MPIWGCWSLYTERNEGCDWMDKQAVHCLCPPKPSRGTMYPLLALSFVEGFPARGGSTRRVWYGYRLSLCEYVVLMQRSIGK
uniref:Uncharacterized protein n=1 Tax=Arundo donax TaxID=35708 RepID=A0A0A9HTU0_ARUDO